MDQALHDERGAAGDSEAGALGQAEEQLRGFNQKRCQQAGRHLSHFVSADRVDQRLPCTTQWGWQDEIRPQVHQQRTVDIVADVLAPVTRLANHDGQITFAGTTYRAGRMWARSFIDVTIVAGSVQLSKDGKVIRVHPIRHDRSRELGAFANPQGRARRKNSAIGYVS